MYSVIYGECVCVLLQQWSVYAHSRLGNSESHTDAELGPLGITIHDV